MLIAFLRECDADADPQTCPACSYSLQGLTRPFCPECGQELTLAVGAVKLHMGWLMAALAPGFFSGIAAVFVLIPTLGRPLFGDGRWDPLVTLLDLFGWSSGIFALVLAFNSRVRIWFLAKPRTWQRWIAITIWFIHVSALVAFIVAAIVIF